MALRRSNQDLESFARISAHDLQEPLRLIASYLQLLKKRYADKLDKDADEFIDFAVYGAHRLQQMITGVLTYSSLNIEDEPDTPVRLEFSLSQTLLNLEDSIDKTRAVITHDPLPVIETKEFLVRRLFENLLDNAIKFHKPDTAPLVHIGAVQREFEWEFTISDNGLGIAQQYWDHVFIIFQRLHGVGVYEGIGIGLTIAKKIVERLGGRIWIASGPGEGTTIHFTLLIGNDWK